MAARVQVISRDIVKPSSDTPPHLRNLKRSYLDQLMPPLNIPLIFFYQAGELRGSTTSNHLQISQHLKQSLSKTLTSFYPIAGRIQDSFTVDCSDAGCEFIEARVHASLMDVIQEPSSIDQLTQYLPIDPIAGGSSEGSLFLVQVTFFDCGGIAIGVCFSHQLADTLSIMEFIKAWAATCKGEAELSGFSFDLGSYFPPRDFPAADWSPFLTTDKKYVTKRFVFDKEKLAALKKYATGSNVNNPTRVEVISAFIWKHFIDMQKAKNKDLEPKKTFVASNAVNLRPRKSPPQLMENVFGNCVMSAYAFSDGNCDGIEAFHDLGSKLRNSFKIINDDYITKAQNCDGYLNDLFRVPALGLKGELEIYTFSSWCRFPVYELDYGWGNPIWFCTTVLPLKNTTILVSSRCGEGIEAWVNMHQDNIEMLETQIKLLPTIH